MAESQEDALGMGSMLREVQDLAEKFKVEEDDMYISPYAHLEKASVLQEARYVLGYFCVQHILIVDQTFSNTRYGDRLDPMLFLFPSAL